MKMNYVFCLGAVALLVAVVATLSRAQLPVPETAGESMNQVRLWPGQEIYLHNSQDVPIEIYVQLPGSIESKVMYHDPATGKPFPLPVGAAFVAQGKVLLSWKPADVPAEINNPTVKWKYVNSMFSYSRGVIPR